VGARAAAAAEAQRPLCCRLEKKAAETADRQPLLTCSLLSFCPCSLLFCPLSLSRSLVKASYRYCGTRLVGFPSLGRLRQRHTALPLPISLPRAPAIAVLTRAGERPSTTSKQHGLGWAPRSCTQAAMAASRPRGGRGRGGRREEVSPSPCYLHAFRSMSRLSMPPHFNPILCSSVL
jgi:hypothetical protein